MQNLQQVLLDQERQQQLEIEWNCTKELWVWPPSPWLLPFQMAFFARRLSLIVLPINQNNQVTSSAVCVKCSNVTLMLKPHWYLCHICISVCFICPLQFFGRLLQLIVICFTISTFPWMESKVWQSPPVLPWPKVKTNDLQLLSSNQRKLHTK